MRIESFSLRVYGFGVLDLGLGNALGSLIKGWREAGGLEGLGLRVSMFRVLRA